ncbi:YraN family protein [Pseudohoeflea coraliihabitans]|uniref:UPF0102 protein KY465_10015 n=1 Tax=Pseudohoeflea coraliihabitans TaxID=2860393 RepID=A0ABS6WNY9_9HYPH|nr:YraN family protein [Pseudohoeflea sp. DP4N28-3]MBW3097615.1 YraN family protein [Pseudohoeflea sp. DP4N28-3]
MAGRERGPRATPTLHQRPTRRRRDAERRGRRAEWMAACALLAKGYKIAALRYRCAQGEVDLIARRGDLVAFVEVKARRDLAGGIDAVTATAQRRIAAAGCHWLARQGDRDRLSWRLDLVVVRPWRWPLHLPGAFEAG